MNRQLFAAFLFTVSATNVVGQTGSVPPKLVVGITIDRLRSDYMEAFAPAYGEGGFKRLLSNGVVFSNVQYSSAGQDRASSVASIYTGTVPYNHGIVGETWLDRSSMRPTYCVEDFKHRGVDTWDSSSPKNLLVSTLGDELKIATEGRGMVYAIAPYREVAVLSAGHAADWAMWLDDDNGKWAGTSYYGSKPSWLKYVEPTAPAATINSLQWKPSNDLVASYNYYLSTDKKATFSHNFTGDRRFRQFLHSGCVNEVVTTAAKTCINNAGLGVDAVTDLLSVCYYAGTFDNRGMADCAAELQDTYVRLDAEIAKLLNDIDSKIGLDNALVFVTSTGYEHEENDDLTKFRIPTGSFEINRCAALLNVYLMAVYGHGKMVESYYGNQLYLNHKLIEDKQLNLAEIQERCEDFLLQYSGVRDVYTSHRLSQGAWTPGISRIRNGYNPKCSGDILIDVMPGWMLVNEDVASYRMMRDSHLEFPMIFIGNGMKPERIFTPVTVDRIAPTVAHCVRIRAPNACSEAPLAIGK